jgi:hypothetical protein
VTRQQDRPAFVLRGEDAILEDRLHQRVESDVGSSRKSMISPPVRFGQRFVSPGTLAVEEDRLEHQPTRLTCLRPIYGSPAIPKQTKDASSVRGACAPL